VSEPTTKPLEERLAQVLAAHPRSVQGDLDPRPTPMPEPGRPLLDAAVLVLLERGPSYRVVFTKRTDQVDTHKGEVSFAGGMRDAQDTDARATALRETYEELAVDPEDVTILGELDRLVTVTGFRVTPVVGIVDANYVYRPNPAEVARVIRVPMAHLRNPDHWFDDERMWRGQVHHLRSCRYGSDIIWGATSRMLQNFLDVVPQDLLP
jgi:8-oxo-dGTP pyrophosphatase MutT (NUDIX family)